MSTPTAKKRSMEQLARNYATQTWATDGTPWSGSETRRIIAKAYKAGFRRGKKQ